MTLRGCPPIPMVEAVVPLPPLEGPGLAVDQRRRPQFVASGDQPRDTHPKVLQEKEHECENAE